MRKVCWLTQLKLCPQLPELSWLWAHLCSNLYTLGTWCVHVAESQVALMFSTHPVPPWESYFFKNVCLLFPKVAWSPCFGLGRIEFPSITMPQDTYTERAILLSVAPGWFHSCMLNGHFLRCQDFHFLSYSPFATGCGHSEDLYTNTNNISERNIECNLLGFRRILSFHLVLLIISSLFWGRRRWSQNLPESVHDAWLLLESSHQFAL